MGRKARICFVAATPLTIHFFFKSHLRELAKEADVALALNYSSDGYVPPLELPVRNLDVLIERKISLWRDLIALWQLYRHFRREQFDLVITVVPKAGLLGMMAAWLTGVPRRIHVFQGEVWASRQGFMRRLLKSMDWVTARLSTNTLAVSPTERSFLIQEEIVKPAKIQVIGAGSISGVDTERFKSDAGTRAEIRAALGIPTDAVVCLFMGRLTRDKGIFELIEAFALAGKNDSQLWLLMVGPDEEAVQGRLRSILPSELEGRVVFRGFTESPEQYIAAADFLTLPSYREGFGMVIIEAAAAGIPAIGTRIHGVSDAIVEGQTGLLVPLRDAKSLAAAMVRMSSDQALRERMGRSALRRVSEAFSHVRVVRGYVAYFLNLLRNTGRP